MAKVVWALWGVFEDGLETFETHALAPEEWTEEQVIEAAARAYEAQGDEDGRETAQMLRATGQATPLIDADSDRHAIHVTYDPAAPRHRLRIVEEWADVELHLG
jgi:hypothetical protein